MPNDLAPDPSAIDVVDGSGRSPFSSGVLAASIAPTGLSTDNAYRIVGHVRARLLGNEHNEVASEDLAALTEETLRRFHGDRIASRYGAWRTVRHHGTPLVISIAGTTGVGKSATAGRLAVRLGINQVISTDTVRDVIGCTTDGDTDPAMHAPPYELVDPEAADPLEAFEGQSEIVAAATHKVTGYLARRGGSAVVEGPHLVPGAGSFPPDPDLVHVDTVLVIGDADQHRAALEDRRRHDPSPESDQALRHFDRLRLVQGLLVESARAHDVPVFDATLPGELTAHVIDTALDRAA